MTGKGYLDCCLDLTKCTKLNTPFHRKERISLPADAFRLKLGPKTGDAYGDDNGLDRVTDGAVSLRPVLSSSLPRLCIL